MFTFIYSDLHALIFLCLHVMTHAFIKQIYIHFTFINVSTHSSYIYIHPLTSHTFPYLFTYSLDRITTFPHSFCMFTCKHVFIILSYNNLLIQSIYIYFPSPPICAWYIYSSIHYSFLELFTFCNLH